MHTPLSEAGSFLFTHDQGGDELLGLIPDLIVMERAAITEGVGVLLTQEPRSGVPGRNLHADFHRGHSYRASGLLSLASVGHLSLASAF